MFLSAVSAVSNLNFLLSLRNRSFSSLASVRSWNSSIQRDHFPSLTRSHCLFTMIVFLIVQLACLGFNPTAATNVADLLVASGVGKCYQSDWNLSDNQLNHTGGGLWFFDCFILGIGLIRLLRSGCGLVLLLKPERGGESWTALAASLVWESDLPKIHDYLWRLSRAVMSQQGSPQSHLLISATLFSLFTWSCDLIKNTSIYSRASIPIALSQYAPHKQSDKINIRI